MIGAQYTPELIDEYIKKGYWDPALMADDVDRNGREFPGREALVDARTRLTWGEVSEMSTRLALGLLDLGLRRDDLLLVQLPNSVELYLLMVAGEKAGITMVTVQPTFRENEITALLRHTEAKGVVIPWVFRNHDYFEMVSGIRGGLPALKHIIVAEDKAPAGAVSLGGVIARGAAGNIADLKKNRFKPYEITRVVTTSGTTGIPKCAVWETAAVRCIARTIIKRWHLTSTDIVGAFYNIIGGGLSVFAVYGVPMLGGKLVLLERFTPEDFCQLVVKERITVAGIVPAEVARVLEYPDLKKHDLSSLRLLAHGTTVLPYEMAVRTEDTLKCRYVQTYGTMDSGSVACNSADDPREVRLGTVGKPYDGTRVKIVDDSGNNVPQGELGEVLVKGPSNGSGYYRNPELNAKMWHDGWFDTTNTGRLDRDGNLMIMGRRRDGIKRGGQLIYPKDIEDMLTEHPKISEVAVVRMPDRIMGEKACAFVVPRRGQTVTFKEVVDFLKAKKLAPFKLPERLEVRTELPLVPAGNKIDVLSLEKEIAGLVEQEQKRS